MPHALWTASCSALTNAKTGKSRNWQYRQSAVFDSPIVCDNGFGPLRFPSSPAYGRQKYKASSGLELAEVALSKS